jgi:predicted dehydrogenase
MPDSPSRLPIAVIGLGAIGRMHIERALRSEDVVVAAIADPGPAAAPLGASLGVPHFADARDLLERVSVRAAIVATPNQAHVNVALACIDEEVPVLVEKPIADTVEQAQRLCDAADAANVPVLVGHQRRHSPILKRAKQLVDDGVLGRPVSVNAMATWLKPDDYFSLAWRREPGGGPVLINLIHDIDMLRFLLGEIVEVQALTSNAVRGFAVEDTAALLLRFANGALGTLSVSDCAVAPWNYDLAAGEAAHYPQQDIDSHFFSGTEGSLTLPRLNVYRYRGTRGWHQKLTQERTIVHRADPYLEQLRHLRAVAEGREAPLCSGRDGLRTLQATLAIHEAARRAGPVVLPST